MSEFWTLRQLIDLWKSLRVLSQDELDQRDADAHYTMDREAAHYNDDGPTYSRALCFSHLIWRENCRREGYNWHDNYCSCHSVIKYQCPARVVITQEDKDTNFGAW